MALLIKDYNPQKIKLPNNQNIIDGEDFFMYKGLRCPTDINILSEKSYSPTEYQNLFADQAAQLNNELDIYKKYGLYTKKTIDDTLIQYKDLYFHNGKVYLKSLLTTSSERQSRLTNTFIEKSDLHEDPKDIMEDYTTTIEDEEDGYLKENIEEEKKKFDEINFVFNKHTQGNPSTPHQLVIGISTQSIRNITGYTYTPIPEWSQSGLPVTIRWQKQMLEDRSNILVIDGSRQMGKSFGMSELLIEESFVPGKDILVTAFLQKTTNAILNYMKTFMQDFSEDDFSIYKKDGYIQNNTTGVKIHFRTLNDGGANVLGLTLRLIVIDEAQLISSTVFDEVLKPTLTTTGGRIVMIGTAIEDISSYMFETIIEITKGEKYNNPGQKTARHIKVSADDNPLIHPLERREINDNREKPSIQRQYFNRWGKGSDSTFNPKSISMYEMPRLHQSGHILLALDPARKKDRSAFLYAHIYNNKVTILNSGDIDPLIKINWNLQAKHHKNNHINIAKSYKSFSSAMDATGVGDAVVEIYNMEGFRINHTIKYTSGNTESEPLPDAYNVSKHKLISNALDMIDAGQVDIISETNRDLMEEIRFLNIKENKLGLYSFQSKFFDDITNAFIICLYIAKKRRYLYRNELENDPSKMTFSQEVKATQKKMYKPRVISNGNF